MMEAVLSLLHGRLVSCRLIIVMCVLTAEEASIKFIIFKVIVYAVMTMILTNSFVPCVTRCLRVQTLHVDTYASHMLTL